MREDVHVPFVVDQKFRKSSFSLKLDRKRTRHFALVDLHIYFVFFIHVLPIETDFLCAPTCRIAAKLDYDFKIYNLPIKLNKMIKLLWKVYKLGHLNNMRKVQYNFIYHPYLQTASSHPLIITNSQGQQNGGERRIIGNQLWVIQPQSGFYQMVTDSSLSILAILFESIIGYFSYPPIVVVLRNFKNQEKPSRAPSITDTHS